MSEKLVVSGCPNTSNPFHECTDWCAKHWGSNKLTETKESSPPPKSSYASSKFDDEEPSSSKSLTSRSSSASDRVYGNVSPPRGPTQEEVQQETDPRKRKLLELQRSLSKARSLNRAEVRAEASGKKTSRSLISAESLEKEGEEETEKPSSSGKKRARDDDMNITAADAEWYSKKDKKKAKKARILVDFGVEQAKKSYDRRLSEVNIEGEEEEYEKQKETVSDFYRGADSMDYGTSWKATKEGAERVASELTKQSDKRKKFSRRREFSEDKDITYINERNRKYNEKIGRFYDEYTFEIQQNLERGTAL